MTVELMTKGAVKTFTIQSETVPGVGESPSPIPSEALFVKESKAKVVLHG